MIAYQNDASVKRNILEQLSVLDEARGVTGRIKEYFEARPRSLLKRLGSTFKPGDDDENDCSLRLGIPVATLQQAMELEQAHASVDAQTQWIREFLEHVKPGSDLSSSWWEYSLCRLRDAQKSDNMQYLTPEQGKVVRMVADLINIHSCNTEQWRRATNDCAQLLLFNDPMANRRHDQTMINVRVGAAALAEVVYSFSDEKLIANLPAVGAAVAMVAYNIVEPWWTFSQSMLERNKAAFLSIVAAAPMSA